MGIHRVGWEGGGGGGDGGHFPSMDNEVDHIQQVQNIQACLAEMQKLLTRAGGEVERTGRVPALLAAMMKAVAVEMHKEAMTLAYAHPHLRIEC